MVALDNESQSVIRQVGALYALLVPNELTHDNSKSPSDKHEQMITDLQIWSDLFTICPECDRLLLICPCCDVLFSDYKAFQDHWHKYGGVVK